MGARALYKPMPEIPESLRRRTIDVVALARFRVAADGSAQVDLVEPTSEPDLNRALLEALRRWRFFPAMQDGKPVASSVDIRIPVSVR
ncbi:MAG TPA: energy transducer TonB [Candidatus Bathyarchaeia archaeon]|nr:energy transducer TonB [Candidatus Bathyarchaeia archaeon]